MKKLNIKTVMEIFITADMASTSSPTCLEIRGQPPGGGPTLRWYERPRKSLKTPVKNQPSKAAQPGTQAQLGCPGKCLARHTRQHKLRHAPTSSTWCARQFRRTLHHAHSSAHPAHTSHAPHTPRPSSHPPTGSCAPFRPTLVRSHPALVRLPAPRPGSLGQLGQLGRPAPRPSQLCKPAPRPS